ncbi:protein kinase, partial [Salmonella sp. M29]|uniref:protein kinase domain-containing protein n=1 Tax=Salmonella sp. M29 TaxID=3240307 RepID=UPI00352B63F4
IRIVDFGIAKIISSEKNSELTQTGEVFGSPLYMSPEQCDGLKIDVTSDIYSLGCVVYFMVCGQPPFNDRTPLKIMMNHLQTKPKPLNAVRPEMFI